ncbi:MAG: hypothetical protein ACT4QC_05395 [Planctomycetaceae bacterium]
MNLPRPTGENISEKIPQFRPPDVLLATGQEGQLAALLDKVAGKHDPSRLECSGADAAGPETAEHLTGKC